MEGYKNMFTFSYLEKFLSLTKKQGYNFITLKDFFQKDYVNKKLKKTILVRIDVDFDPLRVENIMEVLDYFSIKGSFFFRIHGKYNTFSFPVINIIKKLIDGRHEIGIHTELIDMKEICGFEPTTLFKTNILMMEKVFNIKIYGSASHGDHTGFNNLDFWKSNYPQKYGLLYEAYDDNVFKKGYYVSDSQVSSWKKYYKGSLDEKGKSDPINLLEDREIDFLYLLIHPDSFYKNNYHENIKY